MRTRLLILLSAVAVLAAITAVPAGANHDVDENDLTPVVPWQHDGETFYLNEGDTLDVGARWGACTRGLAHSFTNSATVSFDVVNVEGGDLPSYTDAGWSDPVSPELTVIGVPIGDLCTPEATGPAGWWVFWITTLTFDVPGAYEVSIEMFADRMGTDGAFAFDGVDVGGSILVVVAAD